MKVKDETLVLLLYLERIWCIAYRMLNVTLLDLTYKMNPRIYCIYEREMQFDCLQLQQLQSRAPYIMPPWVLLLYLRFVLYFTTFYHTASVLEQVTIYISFLALYAFSATRYIAYVQLLSQNTLLVHNTFLSANSLSIRENSFPIVWN